MPLATFCSVFRWMLGFSFVLVGIFQSTEAQIYVFMDQPKPFQDAMGLCTNNGMTMAMPGNQAEVVAMETALAGLQSDTVAWLGLMHAGAAGSNFIWLNMNLVTVNNWDVTTLNAPVYVDAVPGMSFRCAAWRRSDNKWILVSCTMPLSVICYGAIPGPPVNSIDAFSSFTSSSFTIIEFSKMLLNTSPSTVTSRSDIECATFCRGLGDCTFFTQRQSTSECRLYRSDIATNLQYAASLGINVWKINE